MSQTDYDAGYEPDGESAYQSAVAVIGMSGRFPGANDVDALWRNLVDGRSGLRPVTDEELRAAGVPHAMVADPRYVRVAAPLDDIDMFDASVFGFTPREAEAVSPQHRLFLECTWEALESAGYPPNGLAGPVGVFAGCGSAEYMFSYGRERAAEAGGRLMLSSGNDQDSLASLVSYKLDLSGPSITVQSFCSTSLVAVHLASQSLLTYECDIAVAGGAFVGVPQPTGYLFEEGGILAPDGRVLSFDASARGTVTGHAVAVVALKRMTDALADGDVIHAVILGSATNNGGRARAGYTAPGVDGQADVITSALAAAGVKPETVGYVECHATGTMLGDSIELAALSRAFPHPVATPCVLGSLKPTLGHLDRASGASGLIRAVLAMKNRVLPDTPGFQTPNPALAAAQDRFTVLSQARPWPDGDNPRRAGVSSFGLGGTNAHVVLEEPPAQPARAPRPGPHLLVLSARDEAALAAATDQLRRHLDRHRDADLADVAFTLQMSRAGFSLRRAVVCHDHDDALDALVTPERWLTAETGRRNPPVTLRIPGPEGVPDEWWRDLRAAARQVFASGDRPTTMDDRAESVRDAAVRAVAAGLIRSGVRLVAINGGDGDDNRAGDGDGAAATARRVSAELGIPAGGAADVADEFSLAPSAGQPATQWLLRGIARLWQAGVAIDWRVLHRGAPRRVALPTYPFQRRRYWLTGSAMGGGTVEERQPVPTGPLADPTQWTYLATWRREPLMVNDLAERLRAAGPWLVLLDDPCGEALARQLTEAGADVATVGPGAGPPVDFVVRPDSADDLAGVLGALATTPRTIVHAFSLSSSDAASDGTDPSGHFDREQLRGFYSVLALAGALADGRGLHPVDLVLLTDGASGVVGSDLRHPEHASLAALAPTLAQENPDLTCRHIDVDAASAAGTATTRRLATQILADAVSEHVGPVALRDGGRWVRAYEPAPLPSPTPIRDGSTVLITGGLGDVGLVLARHLASTRNCQLVLTAHAPIPPREQWPMWLASHGHRQDRTVRHVRNVMDLESRGARVLAMSADVADEAQMRRVVSAAVERFGSIDAVLHGAGVQQPRFGPAHTMDRSACEAHFRAKVHGFHTLQRVLAGSAVDWRLTLSSLSAVLGGIALGPYAAANAALDAYAVAARVRGEGPWLTVDWDTWGTDPGRLEGHGADIADLQMTADEGASVFERAAGVSDHFGHLVISTGPLDARLARWVTGSIADAVASDADGADGTPRHPRPPLSTPYVEPAAGTEQTLAEIWAGILGLDRIGVDDNFFELGGNSLITMQLMTRVRRELRVSVPVTAVLENPTVRRLAVALAVAAGSD